MRRNFFTFLLFFILMSGACVVAQIDQGIQFEPETLGLVPGETTSNLNFTWYADTRSGEASLVRILNETGAVINTYAGTTGRVSDNKSTHKVIVNGLKPKTRYNYSVSNDGVNWSFKYEFRTSDPDDFCFAFVGDPQVTTGEQDKTSKWFSSDRTTSQAWNSVIRRIEAAGASFIASAGDQVDQTSRGNEAEYRVFFSPKELRSIPFAPVVGNHDRHYPFMYHFNLPNEQQFEPIITGPGGSDVGTRSVVESAANYWYLYNNLLFIVLNTSAAPENLDTARLFIDRFDRTIYSAVEANKGKFTWLFIQHHKSTTSIGQHVSDRDIQYYVEAGLEKLMDKYYVDFVLSGHDHVYSRTYAMRAGKPINTEKEHIDKPGGTIYLTANTASGIKYYNVFDSQGLFNKNNTLYPYLINGLKGSANYLKGNLPLSINVGFQSRKPGYAIFNVSSSTISCIVYDVDSNDPVDRFSVTK